MPEIVIHFSYAAPPANLNTDPPPLTIKSEV